MRRSRTFYAVAQAALAEGHDRGTALALGRAAVEPVDHELTRRNAIKLRDLVLVPAHGALTIHVLLAQCGNDAEARRKAERRIARWNKDKGHTTNWHMVKSSRKEMPGYLSFRYQEPRSAKAAEKKKAAEMAALRTQLEAERLRLMAMIAEFQKLGLPRQTYSKLSLDLSAVTSQLAGVTA